MIRGHVAENGRTGPSGPNALSHVAAVFRTESDFAQVEKLVKGTASALTKRNGLFMVKLFKNL